MRCGPLTDAQLPGHLRDRLAGLRTSRTALSLKSLTHKVAAERERSLVNPVCDVALRSRDGHGTRAVSHAAEMAWIAEMTQASGRHARRIRAGAGC